MTTYTQAMDKITLSVERRAELADAVARALLERERRPRPRVLQGGAWRKVAAILLAVAIVGGGVAYALGSDAVAQLARTLFGWELTQEQSDQLGTPIGVTAAADGITITLEAAFGDSQDVALLFTLAREDGKPIAQTREDLLGGYALTLLSELEIGGKPILASSSRFTQGDSGELHYLVLFQLLNEGEAFAEGETAHVVLSDLRDTSPGIEASRLIAQLIDEGKDPGEDERIKPAEGESGVRAVFYSKEGQAVSFIESERLGKGEQIAGGPWEFDFELPSEGQGVSFGQAASFTVDNAPATLNEAYLSPLALRLSYTVDYSDDYASEESHADNHKSAGSRDFWNYGAVGLERADGSMLHIHERSDGNSYDHSSESAIVHGEATTSGSAGSGRVYCEVSFVLPELTDPQSIVALHIGATRIPLE